MPLLTILTHLSPNPFHTLLPHLFIWLLIPLLDHLIGAAASSPPLSPAHRRHLASLPTFRYAVLLWPPVQLLTLLYTACAFRRGRGALVDAALALSMALTSAGGINAAHELLHRHSALERALARALLSSVCYGHFFIEHARGHHKHVATPADPATLAFGQSFYSFLPQTLVGGFRSAWRLEAARLRKARLPLYHNAMLYYIVAPVAFVALLGSVAGWRGVQFFFIQAFMAVVLLEQINAIEHYGLVRKLRPDGSYEAVGPEHSWDAPQLVSNYLLFKLQRHADHHLHADKRYQMLELSPESPQLPAGYLTLAPCLLVPPLWRAVMDPVLESYMKGRKRVDEWD